MIALIGILLGLVIGLFLKVPIPEELSPYLALLILSGLDSLATGWQARLSKQYDGGLFLFRFIFDSVVAVLLTALGKQINFELSLILAFVFTYRIFRTVAMVVTVTYQKVRNFRAGKRGGILNKITEMSVDEDSL